MPPSSNGGKEVSPSRVEVYLNKFSQDEKIIIQKKVSRKTVIFIDSENSLRSTTRYLMTIAASNLIGGKIPQYHPANTKLGTYGSQKLVGMMQYEFGKDVEFYPIHRSFLSRTEAITVFISPGKISTHCKENEMLVYSVHDNKTQMYYKKSSDHDDNENAKGMRVKINFTLTGEGQVLNTYVTVSGLT